MNLSKQYIKAVVDTLEIEHNKKYPQSTIFDDGLTKAQKNEVKAKAKRIRAVLNKLPKEVKSYLSNESPFENNGSLEQENWTISNLESDYLSELNEKALQAKNATKKGSKKPDLSIFNREETERKIVLAAMDSKNLDELSKKLGVPLKK